MNDEEYLTPEQKAIKKSNEKWVDRKERKGPSKKQKLYINQLLNNVYVRKKNKKQDYDF